MSKGTGGEAGTQGADNKEQPVSSDSSSMAERTRAKGDKTHPGCWPCWLYLL